MRHLWFVLIYPAIALGESAKPALPKYPIDSVMEGPQSLYTPALVDALRLWPPPDIDYEKLASDDVSIKRLETPGEEFYIGAEQVMKVKAPLARVESVIDDIDHFKEIMPDLADVHIEERDGNKLTVYWETTIPVFFLPNVRYETVYYLDKRLAEKKIYRYKLRKKTGDMNLADGIIVLERIGAQETRFTEYDFWDSNYGIVKNLAPGRIWKDSLKGIYLSDLGVKLKAEHPEWTCKQVTRAAEEAWDNFPVEQVLSSKKRFIFLGGKSLTTGSSGLLPGRSLSPVR